MIGVEALLGGIPGQLKVLVQAHVVELQAGLPASGIWPVAFEAAIGEDQQNITAIADRFVGNSRAPGGLRPLGEQPQRQSSRPSGP